MLKYMLLCILLTSCYAGTNGLDGKPGVSCSVTRVNNGAIIKCEDTEVVILDGINGQNGADTPPTMYTIVGTIDPCNKQGTFDEILLRLENNKIIAHYASGSNQFLTFVEPGSYVTTDGTNCHFNVDNNYQVSW